jgi:hypothetical protein
MAEVP